MKSPLNFLLFATILFLSFSIHSQSDTKSKSADEVTKLFKSDEILPLKLKFSTKDVKRNTNDTTYIKTELSYQLQDKTWDSLEVKIRARGNFRRANCYFPPIKMKIKKKNYKNTLFEKNKTLKFVLPCLKEKAKNDNIVKEYMAYQIFEIISPYHFKTRLLELEYSEIKRKKTIVHHVKGIIIEDDKKVAKRHDGKVYKRPIHPLNLDDLTSIRNALFHYMIGNTDYSTGYQHNGKLIYIDKKMMPVPYDFDMAGLIDASYATVSQIQNQQLQITNVTQRLYRGFKRDPAILQQVRSEFIAKKTEILEVVDRLKPYFENPKSFSQSRSYILSFFEIMINDTKFKKEIIDKARDEP